MTPCFWKLVNHSQSCDNVCSQKLRWYGVTYECVCAILSDWRGNFEKNYPMWWTILSGLSGGTKTVSPWHKTAELTLPKFKKKLYFHFSETCGTKSGIIDLSRAAYKAHDRFIPHVYCLVWNVYNLVIPSILLYI